MSPPSFNSVFGVVGGIRCSRHRASPASRTLFQCPKPPDAAVRPRPQDTNRTGLLPPSSTGRPTSSVCCVWLIVAWPARALVRCFRHGASPFSVAGGAVAKGWGLLAGGSGLGGSWLGGLLGSGACGLGRLWAPPWAPAPFSGTFCFRNFKNGVNSPARDGGGATVSNETHLSCSGVGSAPAAARGRGESGEGGRTFSHSSAPKPKAQIQKK